MFEDLEKCGFIKALRVGTDVYRHVNFARIKYNISKKHDALEVCNIPEEMFKHIIAAYVRYGYIDLTDANKALNLMEFLKDSYVIRKYCEDKKYCDYYHWFYLLGYELGISEELISETYIKVKETSKMVENLVLPKTKKVYRYIIQAAN